MAGKIIDEDVLKLTVQNLTQLIADHVFEEIPYQDSEIDNMFDGTTQEISYYSSLINDNLVSENRLFSSKKIADEIAKAIIDSNAYADGLIKDISSIQLEWCDTSLPAIGESNKIYILPVTSGSDTVNTLNIWNATTSAYVSIGNLEIDLSQYYTKSEIDTKLNDKANKSEVLLADKVLVSAGSEGMDTVYSSKLTKDELDKKVNVTDISNIINEASTDDTVPTSKAIYDTISDLKVNFQDGVNTIYDSVVARGVTPVDKSPSSISESIRGINGVGMDLLWSNPNPKTSFKSQNISLDLSKYSLIVIKYRRDINTSVDFYFISNKFDGEKVGLGSAFSSNGSWHRGCRLLSILDTQVSFGNFSYGTTDNNNIAIPIAIYGIYNDFFNQ